MNVKLVKLSSGEEFICDLTEEENVILATNAISPIPNNNGTVGFIPWAPLIKKGTPVTVDRKWVIYIEEPAEEIVEQYEKMYSPIETPPSKKLIL